MSVRLPSIGRWGLTGSVEFPPVAGIKRKADGPPGLDEEGPVDRSISVRLENLKSCNIKNTGCVLGPPPLFFFFWIRSLPLSTWSAEPCVMKSVAVLPLSLVGYVNIKIAI
jgi:hypothetical protein